MFKMGGMLKVPKENQLIPKQKQQSNQRRKEEENKKRRPEDEGN